MKRLIALTALAALIATSALAAPDGHPRPDAPFPGHGMNIAKLADELALSKDQKRQVALILKENRDKARSLREDMKAARLALGETMAETPGDEAAVRAAAGRMAKAGEELAVHAGKVKAAVDKVLTPEQKARLAAKKDEFKNRFKERSEKRGQALDAWIDEQLKG